MWMLAVLNENYIYSLIPQLDKPEDLKAQFGGYVYGRL